MKSPNRNQELRSFYTRNLRRLLDRAGCLFDKEPSFEVRFPLLSLLVLSLLFSRVVHAQENSLDSQISNPGDNLQYSSRVRSGLETLYTFDSGQGDLVKDRSGSERPLNLKIKEPSSVQWKKGSLLIKSATEITSTRPAKRISKAIQRSGNLTLEAWVKPGNDKQKGPARIVSLSSGSGQRNFTLGQDRTHYETRLRTTQTSTNGIPAITSPKGSVRKKLTHLVYTRDRKGKARFFLNGKPQPAKSVKGKLSRWSDEFRFLLANETSGDRPWLGELHLVAVYSRSLSPAEVMQNFKAGHLGETPVMLAKKKRDAKADHFLLHVAPLLTDHCLECHDSATKEGGLDLSRKTSALAGGESGEVIVPGKATASFLWEQVAAGDMPPDGVPLSDENQAILKRWINDGAVWSGERIDPAIYANKKESTQRWVQRLTVSEYIETVRSAVGIDIAKEARELLPPDLRADGFVNTAYNLNVDLMHVDAYSKLAEIIVQRMGVLKFASRFSKKRSLNTDETLREFVSKMGEWLFRGPLDSREERNFSGIATSVASGGGTFEEGVRLIVEAMLQSPRFIYRVEDQHQVGPVGQFELASRLSYIIWGAPPDKELLDAAANGELDDPSVVSSHAHRMLKDPRSIQRSLQFIGDWLDLDRLNNLRPNTQKFPRWSDALASDMRQETLLFFEEIAWKQNRPLSDLLNAQFTFATPRLAEHYGLDANQSPDGDQELTRYDLSEISSRGGLLTHGSLLTIGGDDASMVTRGLFILKDVLRGTVGDPPPGLDTTPVPNRPGLSHRMIATERIENVACGGCHSKIEPLAFGLEKFDGIGAWHEKDDHGNELRDDGEVLFPGAEHSVKYNDSMALMDLLANSDRVGESITWKVTQFSLGRPLGPTDAAIVHQIHDAAQRDGGTYASLIHAIILSDFVRMSGLK